jgi:hypothetical protein
MRQQEEENLKLNDEAMAEVKFRGEIRRNV